MIHPNYVLALLSAVVVGSAGAALLLAGVWSLYVKRNDAGDFEDAI